MKNLSFWKSIPVLILVNSCVPDNVSGQGTREAYELYRNKKFAISTSHDFPIEFSYEGYGLSEYDKKLKDSNEIFKEGLTASLNRSFRSFPGIPIVSDSILHSELKKVGTNEIPDTRSDIKSDTAYARKLTVFHQQTGINILMYPTRAELHISSEVKLMAVNIKVSAFLSFLIIDCSNSQMINEYEGRTEKMYRVDKGDEFAMIMKTVQGDVKKAGERCVNDLKIKIYKDMFKIEIPR